MWRCWCLVEIFSWCLDGILKMKCAQDLCLNLWYDLKKLLWQDELNPRVRCAFGNVFWWNRGGSPPSSIWWRSTPSCPFSALSPAPTGPNHNDEDDHNDEHDHDNDPDPLQLVLLKVIIMIIVRMSIMMSVTMIVIKMSIRNMIFTWTVSSSFHLLMISTSLLSGTFQ